LRKWLLILWWSLVKFIANVSSIDGYSNHLFFFFHAGLCTSHAVGYYYEFVDIVLRHEDAATVKEMFGTKENIKRDHVDVAVNPWDLWVQELSADDGL